MTTEHKVPLIYLSYWEQRAVAEENPRRFERVMAVQRRQIALGLPITPDEKIERADGRQWAPVEHPGRAVLFAVVFTAFVIVLVKMGEAGWLDNIAGFLFFVVGCFLFYPLSIWVKGEW